MKKIILLIMSLLIFTGCQRVVTPTIIEETTENSESEIETTISEAIEETTTEIPSTEPPTEGESQIPDEELNIMQRVLLNMETFIDTKDDSVKKIEDKKGYFYNENGYCAKSFYYLDLDKNGTKEVIVVLTGTGTRLIFYEIDGQIYMDWGGYRDMKHIYEDGIYIGESSDCDIINQFMGFTEKGKIIKPIIIWKYPYSVGEMCEFYTNWDDYNNRVNDIPKVEAIALLEGCSDVEATEYEFTRNNIETILKDYN